MPHPRLPSASVLYPLPQPDPGPYRTLTVPPRPTAQRPRPAAHHRHQDPPPPRLWGRCLRSRHPHSPCGHNPNENQLPPVIKTRAGRGPRGRNAHQLLPSQASSRPTVSPCPIPASFHQIPEPRISRDPTISSPRDAAGPEPPTAALPPASIVQIPTQLSSALPSEDQGLVSGCEGQWSGEHEGLRPGVGASTGGPELPVPQMCIPVGPSLSPRHTSFSVDGGHKILGCKAQPSQRPGRDWTRPRTDLESWHVILHPVSGDAQACGSKVARASDFRRTWKSRSFYMLSPGFEMLAQTRQNTPLKTQ